MSDAARLGKVGRAVGLVMLVAGVAVFAIRTQHAGPYAWPEGGNLRAGVLSLLIAGWLLRDWGLSARTAKLVSGVAIVASPIVFFFALYATFAELEEVVVLKAADAAGRPADLRLWIVDRDGVPWVTMQAAKADAHALGEGQAELLRAGRLACVAPVRHDDPETVNEIHRLRHAKYAVQRIAAQVGLFGETASPTTVALRLDPCPAAG